MATYPIFYFVDKEYHVFQQETKHVLEPSARNSFKSLDSEEVVLCSKLRLNLNINAKQFH